MKNEIKKDHSFMETNIEVEAVIIVNAFEDRFYPITKNTPLALFPLLNRRVIECTIDTLIASHVNRVTIAISNHAKKIIPFIESTKYFQNKQLKIDILHVSSLTSVTVGDVMREIDRDSRSYLRGHFIILNGFVICSDQITYMIENHLRRCSENSNLILTTVMSRHPIQYLCQETDSEYTIAADFHTNKMLQISKPTKNTFHISNDTLKKNKTINVISRLKYSGVYICTTKCVQLFSDNFDFQTLHDLIVNIIGDDIINKSICYDLITNDYFCNITSLKVYNSVCLDITNRWSYPLTPENTGYVLHAGNVYLDGPVDIEAESNKIFNVLIGKNTTIADKTVIKNSFIGPDSSIGSKTNISNSCIWWNVIIEQNCKIHNSIVCNNVIVLHDTELIDLVILSPGVIVGPSISIKRNVICFVSLSIGNDTSFGAHSNASQYHIPEHQQCLYEWANFLTTKTGTGESTDTETIMEVEKEEMEESDDDNFRNSVMEVIHNGMTESVPVETIITEINTTKSMYNISLQELKLSILDAILLYCFPPLMSDYNTIADYMKQQFILMAPFCRRYYTSFASIISLILRFEEYVFIRSELHDLYARIVLQFYLHDIIDQQFLTQLVRYNEDIPDSELMSFRTERIQGVINKFNEESSCSDSDDEDEYEYQTI